jgi:tetratricopeptide (TPR) repeat protein
MTNDSTKPTAQTPPAQTPPAQTPPATPAPERKPEEASSLNPLPQSPEDAQAWLEKSERFVKLVAENLRYGSWSKRFVTVGVVAFVGLNPLSAGKVAEFFGLRELPKWYGTAFGMGMGGIAIASVGAAIVTLPKRTLEPVPERQAIKGLRSFEQKDAEIFQRLERQRDVQECLNALDMEDLKLFLLLGESGVGKSSLLQAGLLPNLGQRRRAGVYVKLGDRDPLVVIRRALGVEAAPFVAMLRAAVEQAGQPIVLILDQFEQFFVQFQEAERSPFIAALKEWYESDVAVKIVIGIRGDLSDRLVEIQKALGYALRPSQVHRLEKFAPAQAAAVLRVIAETEQWFFNEAFVQEMARDELAGRDGKVAPVEVQVLAQMVSREPNEENRRFDKLAFQRLGGVDGLLGRSLQRSLDAIPVKSERERALEVLLALTDLERNVRSGAFAIAQLQQMTEKVHGSPTEVAMAVDWLAESRLITPTEGEGEGEGKDEGDVAYELAHERLIPALRQVANQELTDANKANLLLDRRVNEWLGSGKNRRYLFSGRELWLLRQQRGFLEWGQKQAQKRELLRRSGRKAARNLAIVSTPIAVGIGFGIWSHTPEGQVQWARWQLIEADRLVDLVDVESPSMNLREQVFTALTLDGLESAQAPLPLWPYFGWSSVTAASMREPMVNSARAFGEIKDQRRARQLLEQLLALAAINRATSAKAYALRAIAEAYIQLGDNEKGKQLLSQSLDTAKSIQVDYWKANALSAIAAAYIQLGDKQQGNQLLSQSLTIAKSIQNAYWKADALRAIAAAYIKLGDKQQGKQLLSQSLTLAKSIPDDNWKAEALRAIAATASQLGDQETGKQLLSQSLTVAKSLPDDRWKASALKAIAAAASQLSDKETGKQLLSQILTLTKSLPDADSKASALSAIAAAYIQLGDQQQGKQLLSQILNTAKSIPKDYRKAYALVAIAKASSKLGDQDQGKQLLSQTLTLAKSIPDDDWKEYTLTEIAAAYIQLGDKQKGKHLLSQSLTIAKSFRDDDDKAYALRAIARAYLELGDRAQSQTIAIDATQSAEADQSSSAISDVAQLHADLGNWGEALRLAQLCNGEDKVLVLARIIRVHAEQKHPEFKALRQQRSE